MNKVWKIDFLRKYSEKFWSSDISFFDVKKYLNDHGFFLFDIYCDFKKEICGSEALAISIQYEAAIGKSLASLVHSSPVWIGEDKIQTSDIYQTASCFSKENRAASPCDLIIRKFHTENPNDYNRIYSAYMAKYISFRQSEKSKICKMHDEVPFEKIIKSCFKEEIPDMVEHKAIDRSWVFVKKINDKYSIGVNIFFIIAGYNPSFVVDGRAVIFKTGTTFDEHKSKNCFTIPYLSMSPISKINPLPTVCSTPTDVEYSTRLILKSYVSLRENFELCMSESFFQ